MPFDFSPELNKKGIAFWLFRPRPGIHAVSQAPRPAAVAICPLMITLNF
jgi:hypothetical protein